jgi:hypothetical protein
VRDVSEQIASPDQRGERKRINCGVLTPNSIAWFIKTATVGWTPHMETCLQALAANAEGRHDHVLVAIARSTVILEDVNALCVWNPAETKPACHSAMAGVSPGVHVKTLRASLELTTVSCPSPSEIPHHRQNSNKHRIRHLASICRRSHDLRTATAVTITNTTTTTTTTTTTITRLAHHQQQQ